MFRVPFGWTGNSLSGWHLLRGRYLGIGPVGVRFFRR